MSYTITKNDKISDLIEKCPKAVKMLTEYGLACSTCFLNQFDSVEAGAMLHGMSDEEIEKMVDEINSYLRNEE